MALYLLQRGLYIFYKDGCPRPIQRGSCYGVFTLIHPFFMRHWLFYVPIHLLCFFL